MVESAHKQLSIKTQCQLLSISRSGWYYEPKGQTSLTLKLMRLIDEQFLARPYYGSRQMARWLRRQGHGVGRHRVRRLMALMGLHAIYQEPRTSQPHPQHRNYPYLLRNLAVQKANQVWCTDISATVRPAFGGVMDDMTEARACLECRRTAQGRISPIPTFRYGRVRAEAAVTCCALAG